MSTLPWSDPYRRYYANPDVYPPYISGSVPYGYRTELRGSIKYPQLFHLLASDTTRLQWDVRYPPSHIHPTTFFQHRYTTATRTAVKKLRIISKAFPWSIDIDSHVPITCEMVWQGLYQMLQQPMADSEWGMLIMKRAHRETVEKAAKKRREANPDDKQHLKRIDYLGEATMFGGLDLDEEFGKLRLLPGSVGVPDTWVVSFK